MSAPEHGAWRPWEVARLKPRELQQVYDRAREIDDARREAARTSRRR